MSQNIDRILLFIPCYNCADQIGRVIAKVDAAAIPSVDHVLVVDNRSQDLTFTRAQEALKASGIARWTVHLNAQNYSLGGSHKVALAYARREGYSHVIVLHGDDQADPYDLVAPLRAGLHRTHDALLGSRFMRRSSLHGYGLVRILGNHVFNALFTLATGRVIRDIGSGLNVFGPRILREADEREASDDLTFSCDFLITLVKRKRTIRFVPISWREEDQISNARLMSQSVRILKILVAYVLRWSPPAGIGQNRDESYYTYETLDTGESRA